MNINLTCPRCKSSYIVKNGHIHNTKQNYLCNDCGRNFVLNPEWREINDITIEQIKRALNERNSLRGICRIFKISLSWLMKKIKKFFLEIPADLNVWLPQNLSPNNKLIISCEADELWRFVSKKKKQQWIWLVMDRETRQIIACHIGKRTKKDAQKLWEQVPTIYKQDATFYTDFCKSYESVIPQKQHIAQGKDAGFTNHIERFNLTLRTRCSRLVRESITFSKSIENHILAIKYFISTYNSEILAKTS